MKFLWYVFLLAIIFFLFIQFYRLFIQERVLQRALAELTRKIEPLQKENEQVARQLQALQNPANIEREFRRAGYAAPGEKVFIIVPKQ